MDGERPDWIAARVPSDNRAQPNAGLCQRCVEVLDVHGAGVSIMTGRNSGPVCSSSEHVIQLEDLQFSLGEGPCHDAYQSGEMVAEADLAGSSLSRWPTYRPAALDLGACAVFAFPLQIGIGIVGALTLYNNTVGRLTDGQVADARVLARLIPALLASAQAQNPEPFLTGDLRDGDAHRAEVHQASGMTAVQLGIDVDEALVRIRAHAYVTNQRVAEVAKEILAHRLHLGDDGPDEMERSND